MFAARGAMTGSRRTKPALAGSVAGVALAGLALAGLGAGEAAAGETRGYVVSWFHMAANSTDQDCPGGLNPPADEMFRRILKDLGKNPAEIEKAFEGFPNQMYYLAPMRGKIDGKPVNIYINPTAAPDPQIRTAKGTSSVGFNLDGKDGPDSFVDPETGERGVDNQLYRVLGCFATQRGVPPARPTFPAIQWDTLRDQMPAWLVEIRDLDSTQDDPDVTVSFYRATAPVIRSATSDPQADMAFEVDRNPRTTNTVKGHIKGGVLTTEPFDFRMIGDPFSLPEYEFLQAHLRLAFNADGSLKGVMGGYQPWKVVYSSFAIGGSVNEANLSVDVPGIYHALKRMADAVPDQSGQNTAISSSYVIEAIPAFVVHPKDAPVQTSELP